MSGTPTHLYRKSASSSHIIKLIALNTMSHKVFIRHTYIYSCSGCSGEWKINEAQDIDYLNCPHCGKNDYVEYTLQDQRKNNLRRGV